MLRKSSVSIAKDRIKALIISDRVYCTPDAYENICRRVTGEEVPFLDLFPKHGFFSLLRSKLKS